MCQGTAAGDRFGKFLGLVTRTGSDRSSSSCANVGGLASFSGSPPLTYHGGPVIGTSAEPGQAEVVPIYWDPSGTFSSSYMTVINGYVSNLAADAGKLTNVFSIDLQYGINYAVISGSPIVDTDALPANGCTPDKGSAYSDGSGYTACVTDSQVQHELTQVLSENGLPSDLTHAYMVLLPKGLESCFSQQNGAHGGQCSSNVFCAYHSSFGTSTGTPPIYADLPYPSYPAGGGVCASSPLESPNNDADADVELDAFSHELNEMITDPEGTAWYDSGGNEIADDCNQNYGNPLGGSAGAEYNQTINGSHYYTQEMLSNEDYKYNRTGSCEQRVDMPIVSFKVKTKRLKAGSTVSFDASKSKGTITSYQWTFGDGSSQSSGVTVTHVFASAGNYTVTLTETDVVRLQQTTKSLSQTVTVIR